MSGTVSPAIKKSKPYKGPDSYQVEDEDFFFGRDREAEQLIAKILSSRFTLVHAQSGAGKTSLLNARVIPGLETRGWSAFRIIPQNDPVESVRAATLGYLLPHPAAEQLAIKRALEALANSDESITVDELLKRYDALERRDPRRRELISPIQSKADSQSILSQERGPENPYFCRLLRSSIEFEAFAEHLSAVLQPDESAQDSPPSLQGDMQATELLKFLSEEFFLSAYNKLHNELNVPSRDLSVFFEHLIDVYGQRRTNLAMVLVLDQFEELFTRFIDPGVAAPEFLTDLPDWRLRWEFFNQMGRLYGTDDAASTDASGERRNLSKPVLPICYVISMRDEYIAQLGPIRRFIWSLDDRSYHLSLLEKEQAEEAIKEPAAIFRYTYASKCFQTIIGQLTKEDRYVEPAHLQLVCEKLWTEQGRELAERGGDHGEAGEIPLETFTQLGETKGILKSFFQDFLKELDDEKRLETLEMLEPLVTSSGTRNIVERDQLVNAPLRDGTRRQELLNNLVNRTIVRTERRLGGYFVEITHEFLIGPILEAMRDAWIRNPDYGRYRLALRTLERVQGSSFERNTRLLSFQEFVTLHTHRELLRWNSWSIELMLRSAIALNPEKEVLAIWLDLFQSAVPVPSISEIFVLQRRGVQAGDKPLLTLAELQVLNESDPAQLKLTSQQLTSILRSQLTWATDRELSDIAFWTERKKRDG